MFSSLALYWKTAMSPEKSQIGVNHPNIAYVFQILSVPKSGEGVPDRTFTCYHKIWPRIFVFAIFPPKMDKIRGFLKILVESFFSKILYSFLEPFIAVFWAIILMCTSAIWLKPIGAIKNSSDAKIGLS